MQRESAPTAMGTTISVSEELADELYERKGRGESYEDVIWDLIETADGGSESVPEPSTEVQTPEPVDEEPEALSLEALVDDVADDVLPGSGSKLEERRQALHAVVDYLRTHGTATPADFREHVYPDHPARYTEGTDPPRSWWKNCVYKGLRELAERTDSIEKPDETGEWTYHSRN